MPVNDDSKYHVQNIDIGFNIDTHGTIPNLKGQFTDPSHFSQFE
jgi:hypothetical protein